MSRSAAIRSEIRELIQSHVADQLSAFAKNAGLDTILKTYAREHLGVDSLSDLNEAQIRDLLEVVNKLEIIARSSDGA